MINLCRDASRLQILALLGLIVSLLTLRILRWQKLRFKDRCVAKSITHAMLVQDIAVQVKAFYHRKEPFRIYHKTTSSIRPMLFLHNRIIDTSVLSRVCSIDPVTRTATVEPNVTIHDLVRAVLAHGMLPKVVMEFPDVTIGGAFSGASGNSSCFRYGTFEQTVDWIEIILGNGQVVEASPQERSDLYYGAAGTFGSLGIVTLLRVQCIPAKPFVKLTYVPFQGPSSRDKTLERIAQHVDDGKVDFVDGILFKHNLAVVMTGHLSNTKLSQPRHQTFCRRKDPWFCMHALSLTSTIEPTTITIPIIDYLFRYDRGAFWGGNSALNYFNLPCNTFVRETLDSFLRATPLTQIIHTAHLARNFIVQDLAVPLSNASSFITDVSKFLDLSHHPVWLCPVTNLYHDKPTFTSSVKVSSNTRRPEQLIDVGLYGLSFNDSHQFRRINRAIEASLHLHDGQKALFASSFYSEDEFWKVYDREWYQNLRGKYHATSLPTIYEKMRDPLEVVASAHSSIVVQTCGNSYTDTIKMWLGTFFWSTRPLPGIWGLYKFVLGGDYLLSRR